MKPKSAIREKKPIDIDEFKTGGRQDIQYPYFVIPHVTDACIVLQSLLKTGSTPLLIEWQGELRAFSNIDVSAINAKRILDICKEFIVHLKFGESYNIRTVDDYLEVIVKWI